MAVTLVLAGTAALLSGPACVASKGAIMLAVNTDMKAPKDVNVVSLTISTGAAVKYNFIGRVTPDGEVKLPATIAIVEPDDPKATIRIRVIAFQETHPRVLRDVRTTVPRARTALLRLPLNFVSDGSATGDLPAKFLPAKAGGGGGGGGGGGTTSDEFNPYDGTIASKCGPDDEQTDIDGACADSTVDSAQLPDYREDLVFGKNGECFDAKQCLAGATPVSTGGGDKLVDCAGKLVDTQFDARNCGQCGRDCGSQFCNMGQCSDTPGMGGGGDLDLGACTVKKGSRDPAKLNFALMTAQVGECVQPGVCFVPLDQGEGWKDEGSVLRLSPGVCRKLQAGAKLYESSACAAKPASVPACGPAGLDGGTDGGTGVELVAKANNASSLVVMNNTAVFSTDDGLGTQNVLDLQQMGGYGPIFKGQWRLAPGSIPNPTTLEILNAASAAPLTVSNGTIASSGGTQLGGEGTDVTYQGNAFYFAMRGGSLKRAVQPFLTVQQLVGAIPDPTAILATSVQGTDVIIVGDAYGNVQPCAIQGVNVTCGMSGVVLPDTPIDTMVASGAYAYAALRGSPQGFVYRANLPQSLMGSAIQGLTQIATTTSKDTSLRLGLAVDANCAYFSNGSDVLYVLHGQSTPAPVPNAGSVTGGTLGIFGVAVGGGYVYFAVHAPIASGGAIYRTPLPQACTGGKDAGGSDGGAMFDAGGGKDGGADGGADGAADSGGD